jgi:hypothetical protein
MSSWKDRREELRNNPETCMSGTRWTPEEDSRLREEIADESKSFEDITLAHQRTPGGVQSHLAEWAVECMLNEEGCTAEEAGRRFRIPVEIVEKRQNRTKKMTKKKKKKKSTDDARSVVSDGYGGTTKKMTEEMFSRIDAKLDAILGRLPAVP